MKLLEALKHVSKADAVSIAREYAEHYGTAWDNGICYVFSAILNDTQRIPGNIGTKTDDERGAIEKWVRKYINGMGGKATIRISNPPGTIADPIIDKIIGARLTNLTGDDLEKIKFAHRLSMSAENILGLILEEYLSVNLENAGWHCAWGETVKSVDFVHEDGRLLQIKNRSNSENSSSSAVRAGTTIQKWFRIKADRIEYMWNDLNEICGLSNLSEKAFEEFVVHCVSQNNGCVAVEDDNPWQNI